MGSGSSSQSSAGSSAASSKSSGSTASAAHAAKYATRCEVKEHTVEETLAKLRPLKAVTIEAVWLVGRVVKQGSMFDNAEHWLVKLLCTDEVFLTLEFIKDKKGDPIINISITGDDDEDSGYFLKYWTRRSHCDANGNPIWEPRDYTVVASVLPQIRPSFYRQYFLGPGVGSLPTDESDSKSDRPGIETERKSAEESGDVPTPGGDSLKKGSVDCERDAFKIYRSRIKSWMQPQIIAGALLKEKLESEAFEAAKLRAQQISEEPKKGKPRSIPESMDSELTEPKLTDTTDEVRSSLVVSDGSLLMELEEPDKVMTRLGLEHNTVGHLRHFIKHWTSQVKYYDLVFYNCQRFACDLFEYLCSEREELSPQVEIARTKLQTPDQMKMKK